MRAGRLARQGLRLCLLLVWLAGVAASAAGARYVTGPPFFTGPAGQPIGWRGPVLGYSTDPGPLSQYVTHAQADAIVAAAAGVWNLPVASITVEQAGTLAEDVSGANVYMGSAGVVFPADVMLANAAQVPLAVVYDADGSVTDTLLGAGASAPSSCRQNAVTETVDGFDPAGFITHAVILVNGRCTGAAAAAQLQLQYQLERVFGRVLGLAWSQANDNVYTGTPQPTYAQELHWPIMHPLDIVCGPYTYQCLPQPFTLRTDDIAAMALVYPNAQNGTLPLGKQPSLGHAFGFAVPLQFPTGEGMAGVNVLGQATSGETNAPDTWVDVSGVTGGTFRRAASSPFVAADPSVSASFGDTNTGVLGNALLPYVPILDTLWYGGVRLSTEPLNPLYVGAYSVGPYAVGAVAPSGSGMVPQLFYTDGGNTGGMNPVASGAAAATCPDAAEGVPGSPLPVAPEGWWNGVLCPYGQSAYVAATVQPGRTLTIEVTALDESGEATSTKMMPVLGAFAPTDAPGALPSLGVAPAAFNALTLGTTSLTIATGQLTSVTIGIADQRNDGRPDFGFQGRLFYADSVTPALVPAGGAQVLIRGMGFRPGNRVTVNGVAAQATAWTDNTITSTLPTASAAGAASGVPVDIVVSDAGTGATSTLEGVLTYAGPTAAARSLPPALELVSAQSGTVFTGSAAPVPFAVKEVAADGVTVLAGEPLVLSVAGGATLGVCGSARCTVQTDSNGMVSSYVTPLAAGTVTLSASDGAYSGVAVSASFLAQSAPGALSVWSTPSSPAYATRPASPAFGVTVWSSSGQRMPGVAVQYSVRSGDALLSPCHATVCTVTTDANGNSSTAITPTAPGTAFVQASVNGLTQQVTLEALSWADQWQVLSSPATAGVGSWAGSFTLKLVRGDGVTPDGLEPVTFSGPANVVFGGCNSNVCSTQTATDGTVSEAVRGILPGTYTVQVAYGSLVQTATFTAVNGSITIVSAPSGTVPVGVAASTPFVAQLKGAHGEPLAGLPILLTGTGGMATMNVCGAYVCTVQTDSNGMASSTVTPLEAGSIGLDAVLGSGIASASFVASGAARTLVVLQQPSAAGAVEGTPQVFRIRVLGPDGVTPVTGDLLAVTVIAGSMQLANCGQGTCTLGTDGNGVLTFTGTPESTGPISVYILDNNARLVTLTLTFSAAPAIPVPGDQVIAVELPAATSPIGVQNPKTFGARVVRADGSPAGTTAILFSVTSGSAALAACGGGASCVSTTDTSGYAATWVTGLSPGLVALSATEAGGAGSTVLTTSFTVPGLGAAPVTSPAAEQMTLVTSPGASVAVGAAATTPFAVRVTLADGVTPVAGIPVTFARIAGSGAVQLGACGAATCTLATDASGVVSTTLSGVTAGEVILSATAPVPGTGLAAPVFNVATTVLPPESYSVVAGEPEIYVAAGGSATLALGATALEDGVGTLGLAIDWSSSSAAVQLGGTQTATTGADGVASATATVSGLAAGATATVQTCLPAALLAGCATFTVHGVSASALLPAVVTGGAQTVAAGTTYAPVVVQVTDGQGDPVVGAQVTVYQTVSAIAGPCPVTGRCPAAPVIGSNSLTAVTDATGQVTVQPLTGAAPASSTSLAFAVGTQGFSTVVLRSGL